MTAACPLCYLAVVEQVSDSKLREKQTVMQVTERQREILERLQKGMQAPEIARELSISRNAVYQQIQRLRNNGVLEPTFTPTGQMPREVLRQPQQPGSRLLQELLDHTGRDNDSGGSATPDETASIVAKLAVEQLRDVRDTLSALVQRIDAYLPR